VKKFLSLAMVLSVLLIAAPVNADPGALYVDDDPGCGGDSPCYSTIQAAVAAASSGDTIYVAAGTYTEQVTLTPGKDLTITGAGRDLVTWVVPADGGYCINGSMSGYTGSMHYEISGFTFNVRPQSGFTWGVGIQINRASSGSLSLSIHDNRFVEDRASGDSDRWGTSMLLCHNRFAARDSSGNGAVRIYNNIDETWGGMTMSNSRAYDIYDNVFDGCSDAIYNGHGCPDTAGQTFGDHHIYGNIFRHASDSLHPGSLTPAIDWQYYGSGGGTHLPSVIEYNLFEDNGTAMRFWMDTDMECPAHVVNYNNFTGNDAAIRVGGEHACTLNAENNYWGKGSGPGGPDGRINPAGKPVGQGDAIFGDVDWDPYLPQAVGLTPHDPVPPGLGDRP